MQLRVYDRVKQTDMFADKNRPLTADNSLRVDKEARRVLPPVIHHALIK
jgi:hypothetical protein